MQDLKEKNVINFIEDLKEITKKYNIAIYGCGCCGSPSLINSNTMDGDINGNQYDELEWNGEKYIIKSIYPTPEIEE